MAPLGLHDPGVRTAYLATKAVVILLAAAASWWLAPRFGPRVWLAWAIFAAVLVLLAVVVVGAALAGGGGPGRRSATGRGTGTGTDTGTDADADTGRDRGTGAGTGAGRTTDPDTDTGTGTGMGNRRDTGHKHGGEHSPGWQRLVVGAAVSAARVGGEASGGSRPPGERGPQRAWGSGPVGRSRVWSSSTDTDTGTDADTGRGAGTGTDTGTGMEARGGSEERWAGAVVLPVEDVLDLHPFAPEEIPSVVESYLEAAWEAGFREVRLIHGKGIGVQRERVRRLLLDRHPLVLRYADAPPERGGWGATLAWLGNEPEAAGPAPPQPAPPRG